MQFHPQRKIFGGQNKKKKMQSFLSVKSHDVQNGRFGREIFGLRQQQLGHGWEMVTGEKCA